MKHLHFKSFDAPTWEALFEQWQSTWRQDHITGKAAWNAALQHHGTEIDADQSAEAFQTWLKDVQIDLGWNLVDVWSAVLLYSKFRHTEHMIE